MTVDSRPSSQGSVIAADNETIFHDVFLCCNQIDAMHPANINRSIHITRMGRPKPGHANRSGRN